MTKWGGSGRCSSRGGSGRTGAGGEVGGDRAGDGSPGGCARAWGGLRECGARVLCVCACEREVCLGSWVAFVCCCFACDCVLELVVCRVRFARVFCPWLRFGLGEPGHTRMLPVELGPQITSASSRTPKGESGVRKNDQVLVSPPTRAPGNPLGTHAH